MRQAARYVTRPAPAVADHPGASGTRNRIDRGVDVREHALVGRFHHQVDARLQVAVRQLDVALDAIEQGRRDGEIAQPGVLLGHPLDVRVEAEDLLDHHHAAARFALGRHHVGRQVVTVLGAQLQHSHRVPPELKSAIQSLAALGRKGAAVRCVDRADDRIEIEHALRPPW
jgi:hypothetical protein